MKLPYIPDQNIALLTGRVASEPSIRYVGDDGLDICEFILDSKRETGRRDEESELTSNVFNVVIKGNGAEEWSQQLREGLHVRIQGLFQSRPYRRRIEDRVLSEIAEIYVLSYQEAPVKKPKSKKDQPVDWGKLIDSGLLLDIPEDDISQPEGTYRYFVSNTGKVFKETRHIRYEVLVKSIQVIDPPASGVDENRIILVGEVLPKPRITYVSDQQIPLCQLMIVTKRKEDDRTDLVHCIRWGDMGEKIAKDYADGGRAKILGRLQSRYYEKEITMRRGKKKAQRTVQQIAYEVSISKILPVTTRGEAEKALRKEEARQKQEAQEQKPVKKEPQAKDLEAAGAANEGSLNESSLNESSLSEASLVGAAVDGHD